MKVIIATDIHGITPEFRSMFEPIARDALFLSPWDCDTNPFENEQEAVSVFIAQNGLQSYAEKISAAANAEPAYIIGFSVGASAAWLHCASSHCNPKSVATLFYGSRIRDFTFLELKINMTVVFAETEPSFLPDQVAKIITSENVLTIIEPNTFHGFMNPRSSNFSPTLCSMYLQRLSIN